MGIINSTGQSFSDDQIQQFMATNPSNEAIAAAAKQYGLNANQVAQAANIGGKNWSADDVTKAAGGLGYNFNGPNGSAQSNPQPAAAATPTAASGPSMTMGGQTYTQQQIRDYVNGGGDVNQFIQQHGVTDPTQVHDLYTQASALYGPVDPGQATQYYFNQYQKNNPNGAFANNYQGWLADQQPATESAMRAGDFSGATSSQKDYGFGGIYGPGSAESKLPGYGSGLGPRGDGGTWGTGAINSGAGGSGPGGPGGTGGIISSGASAGAYAGASGVNGAGVQGAPVGANGITPWSVTPNQTTQGQLQSIMDPNNPIIQQARTGAMERMNDRGMVNSSIATTAGDAAAYQAAIPIAASDAATYAKAAGYNANMPNEFATNAMNRAMALEQSRIQAASSKYSADTSASTQLSTANLSAETQRLINTMDNTQKTQALQVQTANSTLLQTNGQAATAFNTAMNAIDRITQNNQMDGNTKTQATSAVYQQLQTQLRVLQSTSGLNLSKQLDLSNYPGFDAQGNYVGFGGATTAQTQAKPGIPVDNTGPASGGQ